MSTPLQPPHDRTTVSPTKPAQMIQLVQGGYYILGGLLVALFIGSIQGPADHPRAGEDLWLVRVIAAAVAGFGVALLLSGLRAGGGFVPAWAGMGVALALLVWAAAAMALGVLPLTFLIDAALEGLFVVWWGVIVLGRAGTVGRSYPHPS